MKKIVFLLFITVSFLYPEDIRIPFPTEYNLKQTYNDCALFSIKAVMRILYDKDQSIDLIKSCIKERMKNNYTLPWGIENYLKKNGVKIRILNYSTINKKDTLHRLHKILEKKHPVLLLIGTEKYQHYITLLGYNENNFYVYDSVVKRDKDQEKLTADTNGVLPGNRNINNQELMNLWNNGGMFGMYKNYGIECYK